MRRNDAEYRPGGVVTNTSEQPAAFKAQLPALDGQRIKQSTRHGE